MAIVAGFDVHRNQITFDAVDTETGEVSCGRIASTCEAVRGWVGRFPDRRLDFEAELVAVVDLEPVEVLVLQGAEGALSDAVLVR